MAIGPILMLEAFERHMVDVRSKEIRLAKEAQDMVSWTDKYVPLYAVLCGIYSYCVQKTRSDMGWPLIFLLVLCTFVVALFGLSCSMLSTLEKQREILEQFRRQLDDELRHYWRGVTRSVAGISQMGGQEDVEEDHQIGFLGSRVVSLKFVSQDAVDFTNFHKRYSWKIYFKAARAVVYIVGVPLIVGYIFHQR